MKGRYDELLGDEDFILEDIRAQKVIWEEEELRQDELNDGEWTYGTLR